MNMTNAHKKRADTSALGGFDLAEIKTLMLLKDVSSRDVEKILDMSGVKNLEDLDWLAAKNLLLYLRSL